MIDPYTALGLASSIVQFVQFGTQILADASKIRNGVDRSQIEQLKSAAEKLKTWGARLRSTGGSGPSTAVSLFLEAANVATDCDDLAQEILTLVHKLATQGKTRALKSIPLALQRERSKPEILRLKKRLVDLRLDVNTVLTQLLFHQGTSDFAREMDRLRSFDARMNFTLSTDVENLRQEMRDILSGHLRYAELRARQNAVMRGYPETYGWTLDSAQNEPHPGRPKVAFVDWLQSGTGIFWVSDKAGSGKSTLMKFLYDHDKTKEFLKKWAGSAQLIVCSQFFWLNGTELQKSLAGLLRKLCYDVLYECPDLMPVVCHESWTRPGGPNDDTELWTEESLRVVLQRLAKLDLRVNGHEVRLCFFVDGLDEFNGEHRELIRLLQDLVASGQIKVCVSSRPWNPFVDAFGQCAEQMIKLGDLTRSDISTYVNGVLCNDEYFRHLTATNTVAPTIAAEVTNRAQGVFLWVYLVIKQLLRGLENGDSLSELQRRLDAMPSDLDAYFRKMFDSLDEFYEERTAKTFLILLAAQLPMPLLGFSYLEVDNVSARCPDKCNVSTSVETASEEACLNDRSTCVAALSSILRRRINGRCRDLLDFHLRNSDDVDTAGSSPVMYNVTLLHRTVSEFLTSTEIFGLLQRRAGESFNAQAAAYEVCSCDVFQHPFILHHDSVAYHYAWFSISQVLLRVYHQQSLDTEIFLVVDNIRETLQHEEYSQLLATQYQLQNPDLMFDMTPSETFIFLAVTKNVIDYFHHFARRRLTATVSPNFPAVCIAGLILRMFGVDSNLNLLVSMHGKRLPQWDLFNYDPLDTRRGDVAAVECFTRAFPFDPTQQPATQISYGKEPNETAQGSFWNEYCQFMRKRRCGGISEMKDSVTRDDVTIKDTVGRDVSTRAERRENMTSPGETEKEKIRLAAVRVTRLRLEMIPETKRREQIDHITEVFPDREALYISVDTGTTVAFR